MKLNRDMRNDTILVLLIMFIVAWLYTEVAEHYSRDMFRETVEEFMTEGDRFTTDDGAELEKRVEKLETEVGVELEPY